MVPVNVKRAWALIPAAAVGISLAACGGTSGTSPFYGGTAPSPAATSSLNWYAIGQQDGIAAKDTSGTNITYTGVTAATASAWWADILFLPQPTSLKAKLQAHLPASGAETGQWNAGCETEYPAATAPSAGQAVSSAEQQAQAVSYAQQQLAKDVRQLRQDTGQVSTSGFVGAVQQVQSAYLQEQKAWSAEQAASCQSQYLDPATAAVSTDEGTVSADYASAEAAGNTLSGEALPVDKDLGAVHADLTDVQSLGATPSTSYSSAISAGQAVTSAASAALTRYGNQAASLDSAGAELAQTANTYAQAHMCS